MFLIVSIVGSQFNQKRRHHNVCQPIRRIHYQNKSSKLVHTDNSTVTSEFFGTVCTLFAQYLFSSHTVLYHYTIYRSFYSIIDHLRIVYEHKQYKDA